MSKGKQYNKPGSRKNELIRAVLMNGIVPYECFDYFDFPKNKMYKASGELIKADMMERLTTPNKKHVLAFKDFRNTAEAIRRWVPQGYLERYEYLTVNNRWDVMRVKTVTGKNDKVLKSDVLQKRVFRQVKTNMFLHWCGVPTYMEERPAAYIGPSDFAYYGSTELKDAAGYKSDIDEKKKAVTTTRMTGLLTSPGGVYGVYNLNDSLVRINHAGELNIQERVNKFIKPKRMTEGIFLYSSDDVLQRLFEVTYASEGECHAYLLEGVYRNLYVFSEDAIGKEMIQRLTTYGWKRDLITRYVDSKYLTSSATRLPCDGFDRENNRYILVWCVPDLMKLVGFVARAQDFKEFKYEIHCFDWQEKFIRNIAGDCEIIVHGSEL